MDIYPKRVAIMLMSVSTALRAAKILGFWNLKRFVIDKNGGTLYLHCIIFLIPTLPNYLGVSDNGINLTAPRHQIYQVKLTIVPSQWSGIRRLRIRKGWGCVSEILNHTPKGDRSGRGPSFFWPLKETMLKHKQYKWENLDYPNWVK